MHDFLVFLENEVQIAALAIFCLMYLARLLWLRSLRAPLETVAPKGSASRGVLLSFGSVFWPWSMESSRKHMAVYIEFGLFHIAVGIAIGATFIHPYAHHWLTPPVVYAFSLFLVLGTVAGVLRLRRRLIRPDMRALSTPDDYFAISVMTLYFLTALWGLLTESFWGLTVYFGLTALLLVYVPMSKISHYLYMPFTRFYYGHLFGRRGVMPLARFRRSV